MFTATYDPADNKIRLRSDGRLPPELYARVRAAGFIWAPKQNLFVAPMWTPAREDLALELAGEIGDEDTTLVDRAEDRAARFEVYEEKRGEEAERTREAVSRIADGIPLGQPILIGHHSQRHAERDVKRIENGMRKAIKLWETKEYWQHRAAGALRHAKYKELPDVRARRIKGLEADERKHAKGKDEAEKFVKAWNRLEDPTFLKKKDGSDVTPLERAIYVATCDSRHASPMAIREGRETIEHARDRALAVHALGLAHHGRWLAHTQNRLAYERAMLGESGYTPPPKRKSKAELPILNYAGTVTYRDPYHRGQTVTEEATPVTKAELAKLHPEARGTRVSACGTHRIRYAVLKRVGYSPGCIVYLTDSKRHPRPSAEATTEGAAKVEAAHHAEVAREQDERHERQLAREAKQAEHAEEAAPFDALRASLAGGVQVVVNPYLFPTPVALADRAVALAGIEDWHTVLEPSAGTGHLVEAIKRAAPKAHVDMIEINAECCKVLARKFPDERGYGSHVAHADFLTSDPPFCPDTEHGFDRIVMNPPFDHGLDVKHILHALKFLRPGGILVAICANGSQQEDALYPMSATWDELPPDTFASQGTHVRTVLLSIQKSEN
jgi:phospholipid N-methyltransferase